MLIRNFYHLSSTRSNKTESLASVLASDTATLKKTSDFNHTMLSPIIPHISSDNTAAANATFGENYVELMVRRS